MNNNLLSRVAAFLKQRMRTKRWRRAMTCLAAVVVFGVTYALILPAITMTKGYPTLEAEVTEAWTGEELTIKVSAESPAGEAGKTVVLTAEGEGADLSDSYAFNEEGICVITDESGREIELHRSVREDKKDTVDYWFVLDANEETAFTLELLDKVDPNRFAETVKAVKESTEEDAAGKATDSNAAAASAKTENSEKASASNAAKASASNADVAEANAVAAENDQEQIVTEKDDDSDFVEILDGAVINDLEQEEDDDDEQTEIVANLKLSAGIGEDYEAAVRDAGKSADKRGNAQLKFQWKDVIAKKAASAQLMSVVNGATVAVFYDSKSGIPEDAELSVCEIEEGSDEYEAYLAQTKSAMANATASDASKTVSTARFFDITILDAEGNEIQPENPVKVVITYDEGMKVAEDGDLNVVHFKEEEPEVFAPAKVESGQNVDGLAFTAESFSVYGIVETDNVKVSTITATTTDGASVEITGRLPKGAEASITPVALTTDELVSYYGESVINAVDNIVVYDICILVDGEEWEPDETVSVIIKSPAIETKESNEEVTVTHLIDEDMSAEKMDTELTDDGSISFETEGFSLWGLYTFTVDFYFGEQEYHMPGNTQMLLSELFEKLEIESPISDVINVTFSDENLLQIEKNENDWTLTSLLPFDTDENLQVELADGTILTILTKDKLSYPTYTYESEWLQPYVGTFREFGHIDIFGGGNGIACMSRENQVNEENWADRAKGAANNSTSTNYTYDQWTKGSWGGGTSFLNDSFDQDYSYQNTSSPKLFFKFDKINGKANGNDQNGAPLVGESGVFKSGSSAVITWDSPVGDEDTKTIRQAYFSFGYQAQNNVSYTLDLYGPKGGQTQVTINTSTRKTDTSRAGNDNIGTSWAYLTFNASNFVKDQGFGTYTLVATIQPATSGNFTLCDMGWSIYGVLEDEAVPYAAVVGMIEEKTINPSLTPVVNFEEPVKVAGSGKVWFNVQGGEAKSPVNNTDADYLEVRTGTNTYRSFGSGGAYGGDITIESIKPSATSDPWYYNDIAKPNHEQTAPPGLTNFDNCFSFGLCQYSGMTDSYVYGVRKRMESGNDVFGSMMLLTEVNTSPVRVSLKELDLDGNGVTSQLPSSGKSETFHFEVAALNDAPPPERTEYTANFQGGETDKHQLVILLGPFGFNSPGIYQYEIREIPGSSPYWSYDSRTLLLTLTVTLNTDATLDVASELTVKDPENGESDEPVFINQYSLPVCLRLTKKNTDGQTLSGAVFELTAEGESSVYSDRSCETAATSLTTDSKGELVFYGLRKEKTYTLKETTAPNGYILDDTEITIMFDEGKNKWVYIVNGKTSYLTSSVAEDDIGAIGTLKIERTDKRQVMDIGVLKVDETNVARTLPGAEFELTRSDTANGTYERYTVDTAHATNGVYTSGADGRFTMTLPEGYYKLTEVSPPAGYITLQSEIPFQVVDQKGDKVVISDTNYVSLLTNQNTILIKNPYGDALPLTGGTGTQPYTLGGLALIVTVALMYGFRLRRRERRSC